MLGFRSNCGGKASKQKIWMDMVYGIWMHTGPVQYVRLRIANCSISLNLQFFPSIFQILQAQARGVEDDDEEATEYFNAILRAANELTAEIAFVQNQMSPCFPLNWALEMLWSTCVAHVCSKQILDQIGGTEGHKLPDLTVTQLLDLVAWIESFRSTIEETFPNIGEHISKKTYFNKRPDLLQEDNRQIDMDVAKDSLAWANNMLWEVHDLAKDEFLFRTKEQTHEWLDNVYEYVYSTV